MMKFKKLMMTAFASAMLIGCSSTANTTSSTNQENTIVMKHGYGESALPLNPSKVVALDWNGADPLLALGVAPVGVSYANFGAVGEDGLFPWTSKAFKDLGVTPNVFNDLNGYDFEAIAATEPDSIIAVYSGMTKEQYDRLSQIAPTLPFIEKAWTTDWRSQTENVATAIGKKQEGMDLVKKTEAYIAETVKKYPELANKHVAFCWFTPTDLSSFYIYRENDPRGAYLKDLGLSLPDNIESFVQNPDEFSIQLSAELASDALKDVDVIITYGDEKTVEALQNDAIFKNIDVVANGHIVTLGPTSELAAACNPSVLSIQSHADQYLSEIARVLK